MTDPIDPFTLAGIIAILTVGVVVVIVSRDWIADERFSAEDKRRNEDVNQ